ncbi:unnamed protein product, partial [marine sediment metagenome]
ALQELMSHWHGRLYGYALSQLQDPDAAKEATQESQVSFVLRKKKVETTIGEKER